jgi:hypothetical protein
MNIKIFNRKTNKIENKLNCFVMENERNFYFLVFDNKTNQVRAYNINDWSWNEL